MINIILRPWTSKNKTYLYFVGYRIDRHRTATDESCDNEGASGDENNNLANKTSASSSDDPQGQIVYK